MALCYLGRSLVSFFLHLSASFYTCCDQIQEDDILMEDFVHPLLERFSVEKAGLRGARGVREVGANGERFSDQFGDQFGDTAG
jgi:hypothetical protein